MIIHLLKLNKDKMKKLKNILTYVIDFHMQFSS